MGGIPKVGLGSMKGVTTGAMEGAHTAWVCLSAGTASPWAVDLGLVLKLYYTSIIVSCSLYYPRTTIVLL